MLKRTFKSALICLILSLSHNLAYAGVGDLFKLTSTGIGGVPVQITLCLNIKGNHPLSCQNYTTQVGPLAINTTILNHTYHDVGIKVNTPGYVYTSTEGFKKNAPSLTNSAGYIPVCPSGVSNAMTCAGTISATAVHTYTVGGAVSGLVASGLVLLNNGTDNLTVADGATSFQFSTPIASGASYAVTVLMQPIGLACTVNNGSGTNVTADVNNVNITCVIGPLAGDGSTYTYFLTDNSLFQSLNSSLSFVATTSTSSPSGTINAISNNGGGYMYFSTTSGQLWQNNGGVVFSLATYTAGPFDGNITHLMGADIQQYMLFSTSSSQLWLNTSGGSFSQVTPTGLEGTVTQMATDGAPTIIFLTSIGNQVWSNRGGTTWSQITYSGGSLSGNIVALVGPNNFGGPRGTSFYTTTNQVWVQHITGSGQYDLATFPGDSIVQMAMDNTNHFYAVTSSNQMWSAPGNGAVTFTPVSFDTPPTGDPALLACNRSCCYFTTSTDQLYQSPGGGFNLLTPPGNSGSIIQLSGNRRYMYFTTSTNEIWVSNDCGVFTQVTTP